MSDLNISALVAEFHNLGGNYLVERQRSFGRFFKKVKSLLTTNEDKLAFISAIIPQNQTEEKFHVEILLHYKCIHELWNVLLNEDLHLMAKIFRSKWFFKEGFVEIIPEELIQTTFMKVSYLLRMRILKKLNLYLGDEKKSNLYFNAVLDQYGLVQACVLLPSCSVEFILNQIKSFDIIIEETNMLKLYKRDPTFPERYFALKKQSEQGNSNYFVLLRYLALRDTERYWQLKHDFNLCLLLKRKQTAKVLKIYKRIIMKNPKYYTLELNRKALMASINQSELMFFFKELFPIKLEDFSATLVNNFKNGLFAYLEKLDKSLWLPLIEQTFYNAYNENFRDSLHLITPAILQLMPVDERSKYIEMKMAEDNKEEWICYYSTEKATGLISNKINLTAQIPQRSHYIKMLVTTCKVNNDRPALLEVLKYFENRHKNDDVQLKRDFFSAVQQSFDIDKLSIDHIKVLIDLLKICNVKHGSWFWGAANMLAKVVEHHINNNLPIRNVLISYFKVERRRDIIDLFKDSPKEHKFVLLTIADMIEDLSIAINSEHENKWVFYACYVNSIIRWNKKNKKDQIPLSNFHFIPAFFKEITGNAIYDSSLVKYIKATNYDQVLQNLLCDTYWKSIDNNKGIAFYCSETDYWFAKYKPQYIFDNAEIFFSGRYCNCRNFQKFVRNVDISEKFIEKAIAIISSIAHMETFPSDDLYKYKKAIFILASNSQYMNLVQPYLPPESGIVKPDDDSNLYAFRTTIVQALESIRRPSKTLETLLLFLKGDYLHSSISTLYKIAQNTPICYLEDFLRTVSSRAVSVRKHAIFLNATLMNTDAIYDMLIKSGEKETNPSLRKFILKTTLKYFLANGKCNDNFWHLLKMQLFLLNADDREGHEQLLVLDKIPIKYQSEYVELLWQLFSLSQNKTVNQLRFTLLGSIHIKLFPSLSNMFCDDVIKTSLSKTSQFTESNQIHEFIFNCFLYGDQTQISLRLDCVFGIFRDLLKNADVANGASREVIQDFMIKCCTYLVYKKKSENYAALVNILEILRLKWSANLTCLQAYRQFMILNFTALYFECSRAKFVSVHFVQRLGIMFDNMVDSFGEAIIQLFSDIARQFLRIICVAEDLDNNECLLHTLKALSVNHNQTHRLLLVINTLPVKVARTTVLKTLHLSILETVRMSTNDTVQIQLNDYLTRISNS